ncbi:unnamed protein product [Cylindrotheca closterium]|uniref:Reverse transcriptase Ty1/copia-type domain-containing protein n=1 Tax=Cylindrotheca closterium TaxID=2856 RepID=A0AAD2FIQ1_9STRA|nr:unnamed protein product [Cylindrotheca closterium]
MKSQDTTSRVSKGEKAKQFRDCQVSEAAEGETSSTATSETSGWIEEIDNKNEEGREIKINNCLIVDSEELEISSKLVMSDVEKMSDEEKMSDKEKELAMSKEDLVTPRSKKENMKKFEVGKLFHVKKWTRSELFNSEREYCLRKMRANVCDGHDENLFVIEGWSDSKHDKDGMQQSINGWSTFINREPVSHRSKMMPIVALSMTEVELFSAVQCAQEMLSEMQTLNSLNKGRVQLPMRLYVDNKAAYDMCNNWTVWRQTRYIEMQQNFMGELKEQGLIEVEQLWESRRDQMGDLFRKKPTKPTFEKY